VRLIKGCREWDRALAAARVGQRSRGTRVRRCCEAAALHVGGGGARCGRRRAAQGGAAWRRAAQRGAERARRGRGAGKEELGACGGAGAERVEQRRRVGAWRRSEGTGGGSRGRREVSVRLTRGARGTVKRNRTCGPANPKAPEGPMVR